MSRPPSRGFRRISGVLVRNGPVTLVTPVRRQGLLDLHPTAFSRPTSRSEFDVRRWTPGTSKLDESERLGADGLDPVPRF